MQTAKIVLFLYLRFVSLGVSTAMDVEIGIPNGEREDLCFGGVSWTNRVPGESASVPIRTAERSEGEALGDNFKKRQKM